MSDIISFTELQELCGYKMKSKVISWLKKNRIPYIITRNNRPAVNRQALAHVMGVPLKKIEKNELEPDFDAL